MTMAEVAGKFVLSKV